MSTSPEELPHWDMSVVYPSLDSKEFEVAFQGIVHAISNLERLFDRHGVGKLEPLPPDEGTVCAVEEVLGATNRALEAVRTVFAYVRCSVAVDSRETRAQARLSEVEQHLVRLAKLRTRLSAWIGSLDVEALIDRSALARDHAFALRKARVEAEHQMSPAEEELAAELRLTGTTAWAKLHQNLTSQITVEIELAGRREVLPMSAVRNLAYEPERDVRRRAYEAEIAAWRRAVLPLAAALNGIKGETNLLAARRRWGSPLEMTLFENAIDRATIDAMMTASRESFPDFRRYLRAKAAALGLSVLAWYDLFAPVATSDRAWSFDEGARFIAEQFGSYSPRLRALAERAFRERWIDAEPRVGKSGGAWCLALRKDESRVLANFKPSFSAVSTLAHELGHAYHNLALSRRTMLARETPMTLAETASIFCETLVNQAALRRADRAEGLVILENSLQDACQVVVDITSRFLFEEGVFEGRRERELSVDELCSLTLTAQRETYGDGLDEQVLHPFMWAAKPHYYPATLYNYPYMFGLLFGLGLFARYRDDPERFKTGYDDLLSSTGMADAGELGARFGIDTHSIAFWRSSLDVVRADIERFEALIEQTPGCGQKGTL